MSISVEDIKRLLKSACKPVAMPPEFKKRLLDRLIREAEKKRGVRGFEPPTPC